MKKILLIGATGLVGQSLLKQALTHPGVGEVVALTRRELPAHAKLNNVIVDFDNLPADKEWWQVDAVICTLGTTIRKAGSQANFRKVDFEYPYLVGEIARNHGVQTYVLNSAVGASAESKMFYSRTKGELEDALIGLNFPSFTALRPSIIDGKRNESRFMEKVGLVVFKLFWFLIPARYRAVHADKIAKCLLNAALNSLHGVNIIQSEEIR